MAFDIKKIIEDIIARIKGDKDIGERFQKDPTKTVEGLIGVDLPDDQINAVVEGVKAKINLDDIAGKLGGLFGKK
jgi:nucleosome binding factor SPN SPT16 subunit